MPRALLGDKRRLLRASAPLTLLTKLEMLECCARVDEHQIRCDTISPGCRTCGSARNASPRRGQHLSAGSKEHRT